MTFHENRLLADDSHEISFLILTILMKYHSLILSKIRKDVAKFVVCCSGDWRLKGSIFFTRIDPENTFNNSRKKC